ncbi:3-dehydroquinate synthase [Algihabitans albus]|uniref:3-dehydroquinate synthase n=1 Tax=Algihabitans albus TaxID=2164067 RepID=UPI000E5CC1CE|nr:3-dehydroquinate synthase [Algihabitans albus]
MPNLTAERLSVDLGARSYDIAIGPGLIAQAGAEIAGLSDAPKRVVAVTDHHVAELHLATLERSLGNAGLAFDAFVVPAGEASKSFAGFEKLCEALLSAGLERKTWLIALGGGVVGDLTGFAAAVLLRGLDFVQIPTSLLAQVDSSVGGKTGINAAQGKNQVGSFHQPRLVLADSGALATLPRRELLAGYAEVAKYGALGDASFFAWLEEHGPHVIEGDATAQIRAVATSCRAKAEIVAADERESGQRALLNLGHTFGHALEAETGYSAALLHGEAVAIGMVMAFDLSVRLGFCQPEETDRLRRHLAAVGLATDLTDLPQVDWNAERLLSHMRKDKKVANGRLTFVLAQGLGRAFVTQDVPEAEVLALLQDVIAASALGQQAIG